MTQTIAISAALLVVVVAVLLSRGEAVAAADWALILIVFTAGALATAVLMSLSSLFNRYRIEPAGIGYCTNAGMGSAMLILKQTGLAPWDDITDARISRWLPYRTVTLTVERPSGRPFHLPLPLHVTDRQALLRDLRQHAPAGHKLRAALGV